MAFKVIHTVAVLEGGDFDLVEYDDEATYELLPGAVLKITEGDYIQFYAQSDWRYVCSENGHQPGCTIT